MQEVIKGKYIVEYKDSYLNSDNILVHFFSKEDLGENSKFIRKYVNEVSSRRYYRSGRKQWFYSIAWMYDILIPKRLLKVNPEKSSASYIAFDIEGTDVTVINNTSCSGYVSFQESDINHCEYVGKRSAGKLLKVALDNQNPTLLSSENETHLNGDYSMIMFIGKYAPLSTNYSKATYSYNWFMRTENPLIDFVLVNRINEDTLNYFENYAENIENEMRDFFKNDEDKKIYMDNKMKNFKELGGFEILSDLKLWRFEIENKFFGFPPKLLQSMNNIKQHRR